MSRCTFKTCSVTFWQVICSDVPSAVFHFWAIQEGAEFDPVVCRCGESLHTETPEHTRLKNKHAQDQEVRYTLCRKSTYRLICQRLVRQRLMPRTISPITQLLYPSLQIHVNLENLHTFLSFFYEAIHLLTLNPAYRFINCFYIYNLNHGSFTDQTEGRLTLDGTECKRLEWGLSEDV